MAAQPEPSGPHRPSLAEFTPVVAALYSNANLLGALIAEVQALREVKNPKPPDPMRGPLTGVERARMAMATKRHLSLVAEVEEAQRRWKAARASDGA